MSERHEIAADVAEKLFEAELAIDQALSKTAELASLLPRARLRARLAACVGQPAFDGAAGAINSLSEARRSIVVTHEELAAAHRRIGLGRFASGPGLEKPEDGIPAKTGFQAVEGGKAA
ncbi:hypothetical protein Q0812_11730 [Brevundimonas sp. 2R-24]|uniref:Uncharacterized protein n=1 Tax=Peiella sedimenti TaxID=3061083 RepID=A0ABT8SNE1_9CAUL|nr:hypothetical protein [Caulobacteraceae bacterium XZ-24]